MHPISTRALPLRELSPSDEEAWRDLAARSMEPNPFYEADFLLPASRYLKNGKGVMLLVAEERDAGRFHACLPVHRACLARPLSPPVLTPWRHLYSYLGTPLVSPERGLEALRCLLTTLRGTAAWPRVVVLELFGDDGPVASCLRNAADQLGLSVHAHAPGERAVFSCHDQQADVRPFGGGESRTKARQWRRLCRELGDPAVLDRAPAGDGPVAGDSAEEFLAIEAAGWKGKARTALASRAGDAAFYREVTARFGGAGRLSLYSLEAGGHTLAMQTNLRANDCLFDWKVAYNERFAAYGPGAQLQLRVLDLALRDGVRWIDTCADVGDEHQLRLCPGRRRIATLAIRKGGRGPVLALALWVVEMNDRLRGWSLRTLRYRITESGLGKAVRR
jgi:CelD/BcsL family acetyltransferase involved in cellulose biosynthesis